MLCLQTIHITQKLAWPTISLNEMNTSYMILTLWLLIKNSFHCSMFMYWTTDCMTTCFFDVTKLIPFEQNSGRKTNLNSKQLQNNMFPLSLCFIDQGLSLIMRLFIVVCMFVLQSAIFGVTSQKIENRIVPSKIQLLHFVFMGSTKYEWMLCWLWEKWLTLQKKSARMLNRSSCNFLLCTLPQLRKKDSHIL